MTDSFTQLAGKLIMIFELIALLCSYHVIDPSVTVQARTEVQHNLGFKCHVY